MTFTAFVLGILSVFAFTWLRRKLWLRAPEQGSTGEPVQRRGSILIRRIEIVPPRNEHERRSARAGAPTYDLVVLVRPLVGPTRTGVYRGQKYVWRHMPDGRRAGLELEFILTEMFEAAEARGEVPEYKE